MIKGMNWIKDQIGRNSLIENFIDIDIQLQPNGFDLTVEEIYDFHPKPNNRLSFKHKLIDDRETIRFGGLYDEVKLEEGVYKFKVNETINLPSDVCAISTQRSSFMRMGNITNVGFWDAGYRGSGYSIMIVYNPLWIKKNARIIQCYFFDVEGMETYKGIYQNENVVKK
jgi:dUTP pyrophosphatase